MMSDLELDAVTCSTVKDCAKAGVCQPNNIANRMVGNHEWFIFAIDVTPNPTRQRYMLLLRPVSKALA